jgi:SPP1 gp7 family putative phage head morphogenesis protein
MKNSAYWKLRFEQLEAASNKNAVETFSTIEEQFMAAQKELEQQISTWYTRFAKNNGITMQEARQLLTTKQLAEFKWDVKEFIKYGEENALDGAWMKQLENASARFHVSRLEALKMQTQQTVEKLFGGQTDALDALLKKNYLDTYYHTAYEIQKGISIGWDIAAVDNRTLERLISKPWSTDGKNFSERIWSNKANLINEVQTQLTQTIMLGKSPDDAIKAIAKKMGTSKNQAGRLVMTESAYFSSQSQKDCFNELDVEQFEIVATLDSHTSEICQQMDGQVFPMKDFEPGVTAPPFHPWCRSTTVPYFDDNFTERAAKGADGKTYYVDSKLNYKDWKKTFVK